MRGDRPQVDLRKLPALLVHAYTASGLVTALAAALCIFQGEVRLAFLALFASVVIDATDGTLARLVDVKRHTPWIDGRRMDDLVDYLNYTFLPILLIWSLNRLPSPQWFWCAIPLIGSVFAFAHVGAKEEREGFFRGFPSYWNVLAFYVALLATPQSDWIVAGTLVILSILCLLPVRFVYPNRPPCWAPFFLGGAILWGVLLLVMLFYFPQVPLWVTLVSLIYPVGYTVASLYLSASPVRDSVDLTAD